MADPMPPVPMIAVVMAETSSGSGTNAVQSPDLDPG